MEKKNKIIDDWLEKYQGAYGVIDKEIGREGINWLLEKINYLEFDNKRLRDNLSNLSDSNIKCNIVVDDLLKK